MSVLGLFSTSGGDGRNMRGVTAEDGEEKFSVHDFVREGGLLPWEGHNRTGSNMLRASVRAQNDDQIKIKS